MLPDNGTWARLNESRKYDTRAGVHHNFGGFSHSPSIFQNGHFGAYGRRYHLCFCEEEGGREDIMCCYICISVHIGNDEIT